MFSTGFTAEAGDVLMYAWNPEYGHVSLIPGSETVAAGSTTATFAEASLNQFSLILAGSYVATDGASGTLTFPLKTIDFLEACTTTTTSYYSENRFELVITGAGDPFVHSGYAIAPEPCLASAVPFFDYANLDPAASDSTSRLVFRIQPSVVKRFLSPIQQRNSTFHQVHTKCFSKHLAIGCNTQWAPRL